MNGKFEQDFLNQLKEKTPEAIKAFAIYLQVVPFEKAEYTFCWLKRESQLSLFIKFMEQSDLPNKGFYISFLRRHNYLEVLKMAIGLFFKEFNKHLKAKENEQSTNPFNSTN